MTTTTTRPLPNGDEMVIMTNAGAGPIVYINGVLQPRNLYRVFIASDGLPDAIRKQPRAWKPWFAWRPVTTISKRRVWWEHIYRARGNGYVDDEDWTWYYYADLFDVLQDTDENY